MDISPPDIRDVRLFNCYTSGYKKDVSTDKVHWFIILTSKTYNSNSEEFTAIPLTSQENYYSLNYGMDLTSDDFEGKNPLTKPKTFILCDRPCRVEKTTITTAYDEYKIKKEKHVEIIKKIELFLRSGRIK